MQLPEIKGIEKAIETLREHRRQIDIQIAELRALLPDDTEDPATVDVVHFDPRKRASARRQSR